MRPRPNVATASVSKPSFTYSSLSNVSPLFEKMRTPSLRSVRTSFFRETPKIRIPTVPIPPEKIKHSGLILAKNPHACGRADFYFCRHRPSLRPGVTSRLLLQLLRHPLFAAANNRMQNPMQHRPALATHQSLKHQCPGGVLEHRNNR